MNNMENWKDIHGFENHYAVSDLGRVMCIKPYKYPNPQEGCPRNKVLKPKHDKDGYQYVILSLHGNTYTRKLHRLVANHFISNPENKPEVNHKDLNKTNNCIANLEWATAKENCNHHYNIRGYIGRHQKKQKSNYDNK